MAVCEWPLATCQRSRAMSGDSTTVMMRLLHFCNDLVTRTAASRTMTRVARTYMGKNKIFKFMAPQACSCYTRQGSFTEQKMD